MLTVPNNERLIYGVTVRFRERGAWSLKNYTYESDFLCKPGDKVLVPTLDWFSVGEVVRCQTDYQFKPSIVYKKLVCLISL